MGCPARQLTLPANAVSRRQLHHPRGHDQRERHGLILQGVLRADVFWLCYPAQMPSAIWIAIFVGSTIGGFIPELWGGDMISYSGVLLSGVGAFVGLWLGSRASR
jgi:hypothetical protein